MELTTKEVRKELGIPYSLMEATQEKGAHSSYSSMEATQGQGAHSSYSSMETIQGQGAYSSYSSMEATQGQGAHSLVTDETITKLPSELSFNVDSEIQAVDQGNVIFNSFIGVNRLPSGMLTIGDYLAGGAFGQVYRGRLGNRPVALKKIDFEYAAKKLGLNEDQILESLSWEVARLSTVTHPNIVQFYGIYQHRHQDYTYLVMEFCEGGEFNCWR